METRVRSSVESAKDAARAEMEAAAERHRQREADLLAKNQLALQQCQRRIEDKETDCERRVSLLQERAENERKKMDEVLLCFLEPIIFNFVNFLN